MHRTIKTVHEALVSQFRRLAAITVALRSRWFRIRRQFQCNPPAGARSHGQGQSDYGASSHNPDHEETKLGPLTVGTGSPEQMRARRDPDDRNGQGESISSARTQKIQS